MNAREGRGIGRKGFGRVEIVEIREILAENDENFLRFFCVFHVRMFQKVFGLKHGEGVPR